MPADAWIDGLAEGVVLIRDGVVYRLNRAAAELLGTDAAGAIGRSPISVLRDHRLERVWLEAAPAALTLRGRRVEAVPIDGGIALRDVTEARRAREESRELLAVLSHELRTPLTTVHATLEALGYDDLSVDERARLLARALGEADRLRRLVDDLTVDVAPPRARSVAVAHILERVRTILAPTLAARRVRLVERVEAAEAWVDPDKLLQVLLNLVQNAAVHGPAGGTVHVAAEEQEGVLSLTVRDEGAHLPPAVLERMFEPGSRAPDAAPGGSGLGLYVVRSIAERWGGRAWGRPWERSEGSPAGRGIEFGVTAPSTRASATAPSPEADASRGRDEDLTWS